MYKVFINEKVIIFTNNKEKFISETDCLVLTFFSERIAEILYDSIVRSLIENVTYVVVDDVENALTIFKERFKIISAAGGVVKNTEDKTLFIYRLDKWDLPKGKIERGEGIEAAAVREVEEECNVDKLKIKGKLSSTFHIYKMDDNYFFKETFWFKMDTNFSGNLIPQKEEGIVKVEWFTDDEINDIVLKNTYTSIADFLN